jgi:hypothetical protein
MRPFTSRQFTRVLYCAVAVSCLMLATNKEASAQYPVYYAPVQPVAPAVVGYSARRAGLFGQRVVVRPVFAPVAVSAPVVAARPVVAPAPVVAARPVLAPAPVTVRAYYAPPVPVAVPVTTYRVPVAPYVPVYGF